MFAAIAMAGAAMAGTDVKQGNTSESAPANAASPAKTATAAKMPAGQTGGKGAIPLSLVGLDGAMHRLEDWKGKVVVLNFWATWCSPCLSEIPDLVVFQEQYGTKGLQIVGVGMDEEKKLRNVQRSLDINYPLLIADPKKNGRLMESWGNNSGIVPYSVVIDRHGRVAYTQHGQIDRETFDENILPLLGGI